MAGDWIPIATDLIRRREVGIIAQQISRSPQEVAGFLLEFWGWASSETEDGRIRGYSVATTCATLGHPAAFYHALLQENVGWLIEENGDLVITNWERWLSNSAKARLGKSLGQRLLRAKKVECVATNVATKLLPEERRGENSIDLDETGRDETPIYIDWGEARKEAEKFSGHGMGAKPQDRSLVLKMCGLVQQGRIPRDWLETAAESVARTKRRNPGAYVMAIMKSKAKEAGLDFRRLLAETPEPPAKGTP